ncbi:MAG: hypothetical protein LUG18_06605 [Candidatus Azobacteroides sp.]|nr:hypothetical protein [Candidatus Azobacteroides sp.]
MKKILISTQPWHQESTEALWKRISHLIPHAKEDFRSFDEELNEEREFLEKFISDYEKSSYTQHYLDLIDDLEKYGYIGSENENSEALLLKSIIAVTEKKQKRPLFEVLHMIIFNKASYKRFFEIYIPLPNKVRNYLGSIIARLENQQKAIEKDLRLINIWEDPKTA